MAGPSNLIKAQILANLNALVSAGTLKTVLERDLNTNVLEEDLPDVPCAILGTSRMESEWAYQQANRRTYTFDILVVQLQDNISAMGDMEDLRDAVALQFDNDVTLNGTAVLGVAAVASERMTYKGTGGTYVLFVITVKASTLANLTYSF